MDAKTPNEAAMAHVKMSSQEIWELYQQAEDFQKQDAFLELEQLVLSGDEPALTLFLMDELLEDRQWQRTMSVARVLAERDDDYGDQARYRHVVALYRQAVAGGHLADFPQMAIAIAPRVRDTELRRKIAETIGEAYTQLEMLEHAADAFRGILR